MQRGLGGFPHERLHQDGNRERDGGVGPGRKARARGVEKVI
ncbi:MULTISPECIES: hypothetical protein [unclassified Moorena]|nr:MULTISPECIES: hypothetical protein [unclassified Moorena]